MHRIDYGRVFPESWSVEKHTIAVSVKIPPFPGAKMCSDFCANFSDKIVMSLLYSQHNKDSIYTKPCVGGKWNSKLYIGLYQVYDAI